MPQDVKLVVYDTDLVRMALGGVPERFPHVHDTKTDAASCFRPDFLEKEVHILFLATFAAEPDWTLLIQISDNDHIRVASPDRDLIYANGPQALGGRMLGHEVSHVAHLDAADLVPA